MEAEGIKVVMTRTGDGGLYDENASNKTVQDMKRRLEIIEEANPMLVVSIHQNSYHEEYVKGAQVFYYQTSENSRRLAEMLQEELKSLDAENHREAKGNDSYYLLKKTSKPIAIVECGFLSNADDLSHLKTGSYRLQLAAVMLSSYMQYIRGMTT